MVASWQWTSQKIGSHFAEFEQIKNSVVIFAVLALNKSKTPFEETAWLTGYYATPLVTLIFGVTMLLTGRHTMPVVI